MKLAGVREGDLVLADVRGCRFYALVGADPDERDLRVDPISRPQGNYYRVSARQVVAHWRLAGRKMGGAA